jgi:hypothetical protein
VIITVYKNDLTTQANNFSNRIAIQDLSTEMVELSDEVLSQVCGGRLVWPDVHEHYSLSDAVDPAIFSPHGVFESLSDYIHHTWQGLHYN